MHVITLISDWKNSDFYVAALKGSILKTCSDAEIIDISHNINQFSVSQAAFILKNSFNYFPEGTIHVVAVKSEATEKNPYVIVKIKGHYFIGCDNGIFGLLDSDIEECAAILPDEKFNSVFYTFGYIAGELFKGKKPLEIGEKYNKLLLQVPMLPTIDDSVINGSVMYIDSFSNAITNITREIFERVSKKRKFDIFVQSNHYKISKINKRYSETSPGELLAIYNSSGNLEIAINNGNAAELLNLELGSVVRIKFH